MAEPDPGHGARHGSAHPPARGVAPRRPDVAHGRARRSACSPSSWSRADRRRRSRPTATSASQSRGRRIPIACATIRTASACSTSAVSNRPRRIPSRRRRRRSAEDTGATARRTRSRRSGDAGSTRACLPATSSSVAGRTGSRRSPAVTDRRPRGPPNVRLPRRRRPVSTTSPRPSCAPPHARRR